VNVLHVCNSASGGAALSTLGLIDKLRDMGVTSSIVCHDAGSPKERQDMADAVEGRVIFTTLYWWNKKIRSTMWKRPLLEARQLWRTGFTKSSTAKVIDFAQRNCIDLIHSNTILTLEGAHASRAMNVPHVWHVRELVGRCEPFQFSLEGQAWGNFVARNCDALIANSMATREKIENYVPAAILHTIPNGIDLARFTKKDVSNSDNQVVVGMVASLTSRVKNHELFIRAASEVSKDLDIEFRIYGHDPTHGGTNSSDGYANSMLQLIDALGLNSRLRIAGFRELPEEIMAEIDILVHPTHQESFGRVLVEAMAAGIPVIGMLGGGAKEIVADGQTGWLIEPGDTPTMARRISELAANPTQRSVMGEAGLQRAEQLYSLDSCARRVFDVYQQVVSPRNSIAPQPATV
jgi:glycosyltransferase involved in cell wall biosynthesis